MYPAGIWNLGFIEKNFENDSWFQARVCNVFETDASKGWFVNLVLNDFVWSLTLFASLFFLSKFKSLSTIKTEAHISGVFDIFIWGHLETFLFCPVPSPFLFAVMFVCMLWVFSDVAESHIDSSWSSEVGRWLAEGVVVYRFHEGAPNSRSARLSLRCSLRQSHAADPFACPTPKT